MIKVLSAGFYTTIQDTGRIGYGSIGVPVSGVMDSYTATLANTILNNSLDAAVLEIMLGGCRLKFMESTNICISGGDFSPKLNDKPVSLNTMLFVEKDAVLSFGKVHLGVRCYLAVQGGFLTEKILQSRSYYQGITKDFLVRKNDILPTQSVQNMQRNTRSSVKVSELHFTSQMISCYKGPEYELLNVHQKQKLENTLFTISKDHNRMGYRLKETINNDLKSMLTSAVLPGTVQLTPSGKLIVLMRDCQVTGGYPRVLQLSEKGINALAQKTTENRFSFAIKEMDSFNLE